jgi:uncharacterized membrane protein
VFLYVGVYDDPADAQLDLDEIAMLHHRGLVGTYDAALVFKDEHGEVKVDKHEKPTRHGVWGGLAAGAVLGVLFPPSVIASALVGGVTGGLIGHFSRGMSRMDIDELGEQLEDGQAAVVVVGHDRPDRALDKILHKAVRRYDRVVDVDAEDIAKAVAEAEAQEESTARS